MPPAAIANGACGGGGDGRTGRGLQRAPAASLTGLVFSLQRSHSQKWHGGCEPRCKWRIGQMVWRG